MLFLSEKMKTNKHISIIDQCCEAYGMSIKTFADYFNLSEPTLKRWRDPAKLPAYGKLLFESLIRIKELEKGTKILDDMANYFDSRK